MPSAAQAAAERYVKYYTVTTGYKGSAENLTEIAERFLGSGSRSGEIFDRNVGRKQPDGKALTDSGSLRAGWLLVMPWDAVGSGIQYGVLPDNTPAPAATTSKPKPTKPATTTPSTGTRPSSGVASAQPGPAAAGGCTSVAASSAKSDWARLRLAADKAWPQSRGKGQVVAVIDSGVNGAMPQLAGRVAGGADMIQPSQRGDSDCLGTGTAMAALVVAQQVNGQGPAGAAPDATVLPIRITVNQPAATPEVQVKAIGAAVAAGATVIALGTYVDASDATVAQAIAAAITKNVVVVLGAPAPAKQVNPQAKIGEGMLRVAGVGVDDKWAVDYRKGAVDLTAPGVNVSSLGGTSASGATGGGAITGSGTHYAVAYTAAEAALVRAAYPELTAEQVTRRMKITADRMGDGNPPDNQYGWGFLNPAEAVTRVLAEEARAVPSAPAGNAGTGAADSRSGDLSGSAEDSGGRSTILVVTALFMIAAAILLGNRIWRLLRKDPAAVDDGPYEEPELDLYDTRFRTPAPVLASRSGGPAPAAPSPVTPPPAAGSGFGGQRTVDDGGEGHWSEVGGHWSDRSPTAPQRG
ncbi:MAG TPA: S8 family serine peptidase [Actinoplanes sp.]|nr:S8 family serine peptidase [Actinoplanes sp.]